MKGKYRQFMEQRAEQYGWFIVEHEATVRATAEKFRVSKSSVHQYVTVILLNSNGVLAKEVRKVLNKNKAERHIRGGMATKRKYEMR